jgi:hypothetical protein
MSRRTFLRTAAGLCGGYGLYQIEKEAQTVSAIGLFSAAMIGRVGRFGSALFAKFRKGPTGTGIPSTDTITIPQPAKIRKFAGALSEEQFKEILAEYNAQPDPRISEGDLHKILTENLPAYFNASKQHNVPWEMIAAIHYREHSLGTDSPGAGGPFQFDPPLNRGEESFPVAAVLAAEFIQGKCAPSEPVVCAGKLTADTTDIAVLADAFWGYNGREYKNAQGQLDWHASPYVFNWFYAKGNPQLNVVGSTPSGWVNNPDGKIGALRYYIELVKLGVEPE